MGSFKEMETKTRKVTEISPQADKMVLDLKEKKSIINQRLKRNRNEMDSLRANDASLAKLLGHDERKAYIRGKIALYVEKVPSTLS